MCVMVKLATLHYTLKSHSSALRELIIAISAQIVHGFLTTHIFIWTAPSVKRIDILGEQRILILLRSTICVLFQKNIIRVALSYRDNTENIVLPETVNTFVTLKSCRNLWSFFKLWTNLLKKHGSCKEKWNLITLTSEVSFLLKDDLESLVYFDDLVTTFNYDK